MFFSGIHAQQTPTRKNAPLSKEEAARAWEVLGVDRNDENAPVATLNSPIYHELLSRNSRLTLVLAQSRLRAAGLPRAAALDYIVNIAELVPRRAGSHTAKAASKHDHAFHCPSGSAGVAASLRLDSLEQQDSLELQPWTTS